MPATNEFDAREFRNALGTFTTGVTIVTTLAENGDRVGLTANSFNSVSLDPPMVLWSLAKTSGSLDVFKQAKHWAVHILADDQDNLSNTFAKKGMDKFEGIDCAEGIGGIPLLPGCTAVMQCKTEYAYEGGDHIIFVGRVLDFARQEKKPLVFLQGRYAVAAGKPSLEEVQSATITSFSSNALDYLLPRAHYQIYMRVRAHHESLGLNDPQYFVLCSLSAQNYRAHGEINAMFSITGHKITQGDIDSLVDRKLITTQHQDNELMLSLTEDGKDLAMKVIAHSKSIEADILGQFEIWEAVQLKSLLRRLVQITDTGLPPMWENNPQG